MDINKYYLNRINKYSEIFLYQILVGRKDISGRETASSFSVVHDDILYFNHFNSFFYSQEEKEIKGGKRTGFSRRDHTIHHQGGG